MPKPDRGTWDAYWKGLQTQSSLCAKRNSRLFEFITSLIQVRSKKILEVGCGTGRDSLLLAEIGASAILVDFSFQSSQNSSKDNKEQSARRC